MLPSRLKFLPQILLTPLPLPLFQPALNRIVRATSRRHPEIFSRLGPHAKKTFLINPVNMPFAFLLHPDPDSPRMQAIRSKRKSGYDAGISGSFFDLLRLIDGRMDGDAVFFSRELQIEGDTEAIVCLRNALDDVEGSIAEDVAALFGKPGRIALSVFRKADSK